MAYIYKITNELNAKCYVGKTQYANPEKRFQQHLKDSSKFPDRPLYRAINKYGAEYFSFEIIEETDNSEEREIYWIKKLNSYGSTGYNATLGGDGKKYLDHEKILEDYSQIKNMSEVARLNGCHVDSVKSVLENNSVKIETTSSIMKAKYGKKVTMLSLSEEPVREFDSLYEAATYMVENKLTNCKHSTIRTHIGEVCKGKRKTASKFKWRFVE